MKATKKLAINLFAISLSTCLASSALATGAFHYSSEYLGRNATPQEVTAVVAADRQTERQPEAINTADNNELTYYSEYMGGATTSSREAQTVEKDLETMATPAITANSGGNCQAKFYSEYDNQYKCL